MKLFEERRLDKLVPKEIMLERERDFMFALGSVGLCNVENGRAMNKQIAKLSEK